MTTLTDALPTTLPDLDAILTLIPRFTTSQQAYILALVKYGNTEAACRDSHIDADTISTWRAPSRDPEQLLRRVEAAIEAHRGTFSVALARQHLTHHAVASAERLAARAVSVSDSPRQDAIYAHASETLLEAVGVIQRQPQTVVQVAQVGADPAVLRDLLAQVSARRQALETATPQLQAGGNA